MVNKALTYDLIVDNALILYKFLNKYLGKRISNKWFGDFKIDSKYFSLHYIVLGNILLNFFLFNPCYFLSFSITKSLILCRTDGLTLQPGSSSCRFLITKGVCFLNIFFIECCF